MSNALSIPIMATRCLSFCLAALLAPLCTLAIYPAYSHETVLVKNHPASCQKGSHATALPMKRPAQKPGDNQYRAKNLRRSLKDPVYSMDNGKIWSCAFFSCDGAKQQAKGQMLRPSPALRHLKLPATASTQQPPFATASPKTTDRLDIPVQAKADTTRVAVLRIDAELKRLILALLKQKQPNHNNEDSHCQDMVRGIAYRVHHSPNREQLGDKTKDLALDMQYQCRKQHFLKAYNSYQKLMTIIDDNIR